MNVAPPFPTTFVFHHLGYATRSIDREAAPLLALGYQPERPPFEDSVQGVRGCFLVGGGPRIELLENLPGSSTLDAFLGAGIKLYHTAYEVDSVDEALAFATAQRARVLSGPSPAVAFDRRPIAFVMFRTGLIVEWIERPPAVGSL